MMDIVNWFLGIGILFFLCIFVRFITADGDFTLLWSAKFGKSTASLAGRVVWITGASSGIGEHLAYQLANAGCKLVLSARREEELQRVKEKCIQADAHMRNNIFVLPLDLLDFKSHGQAVTQILQKFHQIDILVNNAGRSQKGWAAFTSVEVDQNLMELNVVATLSLTKAVIPHMLRQKQGHLVVTSSIAGKSVVPLSAIYSASKFALHGWFDALRVELANSNICVTLVCPGPVFTNLRKQAYTESVTELRNEEMSVNERRMSVRRCAELMAVSIANKLDEVWVSPQPVLATTYIAQYMPTLFRWLAVNLGLKTINKLRYGVVKKDS